MSKLQYDNRPGDKLTEVRSLSKQRLRTWLTLLRASRYVESRVRSNFRALHNSTLSRFDVMSVLDRHPEGLKMREISGQLRVSNGNITGIIKRLVLEGHVLRLSNKNDKRVMRVKLTASGKRYFEKAAREHEKWINTLLEDFNSEELDELLALLSRMGKADQ